MLVYGLLFMMRVSRFLVSIEAEDINSQLCLFIVVIRTSKHHFTLHFKLSLTAQSVCHVFSLHSTVFHFSNYKRNCDSMNLCCKQI